MSQPANKLPTKPQRVEAFALFFKRYMSISTVVAAALPIPVTAFKLIPTLPFQTQELSVFTPLFCFLVLAFIFYSRHGLARWMFATVFLPPMSGIKGKYGARLKEMLVGVLSLVLIIAAFGAVMSYRWKLNFIVDYYEIGGSGPTLADLVPELVANADQLFLMVSYLAIFIAAEAAFVLMAIKEYLQDYLNLEDSDLIAPR